MKTRQLRSERPARLRLRLALRPRCGLRRLPMEQRELNAQRGTLRLHPTQLALQRATLRHQLAHHRAEDVACQPRARRLGLSPQQLHFLRREFGAHNLPLLLDVQEAELTVCQMAWTRRVARTCRAAIANHAGRTRQPNGARVRHAARADRHRSGHRQARRWQQEGRRAATAVRARRRRVRRALGDRARRPISCCRRRHALPIQRGAAGRWRARPCASAAEHDGAKLRVVGVQERHGEFTHGVVRRTWR